MTGSAPDYRSAFDLAPIGLVLSRQRLMIDCNQELLSMFAAQRDQLIGQSFQILYPSADEFRRTGSRIEAELDAQGRYADERVMKRFVAVARKWRTVLVPCQWPCTRPGATARRRHLGFRRPVVAARAEAGADTA